MWHQIIAIPVLHWNPNFLPRSGEAMTSSQRNVIVNHGWCNFAGCWNIIRLSFIKIYPVFSICRSMLCCWKEPLQAIQNYTQINQADRPSICTIKIVFCSWFRTFYHILAVLFEGLESRPQKIRQSDVQHVPGASKYHQNHGFPTVDGCEIPHHQKNGFSTQSSLGITYWF